MVLCVWVIYMCGFAQKLAHRAPQCLTLWYNSMQVFQAVEELSATMKPDGTELEIFRFVLGPFFRNALPKNKSLLELFQDKMVPRFGEKDALAHLWYGVDAIGDHNNSISDLFEADTILVISNSDVRYRRMLVDVAMTLAEDVDKSKKFIRYVVTTRNWRHVRAENFMPPEEKERNYNMFVSCIIKLFKEANEQRDSDIKLLEEWLDACSFKKLACDVANFNHEEVFRKECKPVHVQQLRFNLVCDIFSYCIQADT